MHTYRLVCESGRHTSESPTVHWKAVHTSQLAAVKVDCSVVTWGCANRSGDSSAVAASLAEGVASVVGTENAFAAVKADGSVVTWGDAENGGDSSADAASLAEGVASVVGNLIPETLPV